MKILLLNSLNENVLPEYPDEKGESYIDTKDFGRFPPLGLLYILTYLENNTSGHELYFKDCIAEAISYKDLESIISRIRPDIVGITSFTVSMVDVCKTAKVIRRIIPDAHICLGGHHPIAFPFQAAGLEEFDSVIVGEGEVAFTRLVNTLQIKGDITRIPGVYTSDSIKKCASVKPEYIEDIDSLPAVNRSFIRHIDYHSTVGKTDKLATIITSRGCPYRCAFCSVPYKKYRQRSIPKVLDEVEDCLRMGYEEFHFYDDLFNITPHKVIDFSEEVKKRKLKFIWDFRGRVNTVTKESLEKAKEAGCRMVSFGVETGSDEGLRVLNKDTTVEKTKEVFRWCRELKIKTIADFIIGLPTERTRGDILKNIDFLIDLDPDYTQISLLCLYPNTEIYDQALKKGLVKSGKWEKFSQCPTKEYEIDHWEEFLTTREMVELQKIGYKRYYLRLSYIIRSILNTESMYEFISKIKGFLKLSK